MKNIAMYNKKLDKLSKIIKKQCMLIPQIYNIAEAIKKCKQLTF
jgi:hypothetical protein